MPRYAVTVAGNGPKTKVHEIIVTADDPKQAGWLAVQQIGGQRFFWTAEKVVLLKLKDKKP